MYLLFVCDGSMLEPILNCLCMYLSEFISCILRVGRKFAKMSLIANGLNAFHVYTHVLHAICDGMATSQFFVKSYLFTYSTVIYMLNSLFSEEGKCVFMVLIV